MTSGIRGWCCHMAATSQGHILIVVVIAAAGAVAVNQQGTVTCSFQLHPENQFQDLSFSLPHTVTPFSSQLKQAEADAGDIEHQKCHCTKTYKSQKFLPLLGAWNHPY